jgi:hypothetical protein
MLQADPFGRAYFWHDRMGDRFVWHNFKRLNEKSPDSMGTGASRSRSEIV